MLHVIDNLLPANALQDLRDLCDIQGAQAATRRRYSIQLATRNRFSPLDSRSRSASRRRSLPRRGPAPSGNTVRISACRSRVVVNTNNDLDWHIDKDELEGRRSGRFLLPLLSTVFYPT